MNRTKPLHLLYEDNDILVCVKPHGLATQTKRLGTMDLEHQILNYLAEKHPGTRPYLAVIHRLDQPVSGILVFAKNKTAAADLNRQMSGSSFCKQYRARVHGVPAAASGTLCDYLVRDAKTNTSRVCDADTPGAKAARLSYEIVERISEDETLLSVTLDTGRHHQIRVQLAHMGCPIIGDTKYNPHAANTRGYQEIKLCACRLTFRHPRTGKPMEFEIA